MKHKYYVLLFCIIMLLSYVFQCLATGNDNVLIPYYGPMDLKSASFIHFTSWVYDPNQIPSNPTLFSDFNPINGQLVYTTTQNLAYQTSTY